MISFDHVTREFRAGNSSVVPVRNAVLDIPQGSFGVITGRSGAGKSTLLNLAAGLIRPTSGNISIDGHHLHEMSQNELAEMRRTKIGYIFQFASLLQSLNVIDNVMLPLRLGWRHPCSDDYRCGAELLEGVGINEKAQSYPQQLSAGEQKRVVIARALLRNPALLLADEPTSDLDEATEHEMMKLFADIHKKGTTILMVTHSSGLATYATQAYRMDTGRLYRQ